MTSKLQGGVETGTQLVIDPGQVTRAVDPLGATTLSYYQENGLLYETRDPAGTVLSTEFRGHNTYFGSLGKTLP